MIALAIVATVLAADVRDFFPLTTGTKWTYETTANGPKVVTMTEAMPAETIDSEPATPLRTKIGGQVVETLFYRAKEDSLFVVAYKATQPLDEPRTILMLPTSGPAKWSYETNEEGIPLKVSCEANLRGKRTVLDKEADVIELKLEATLGDAGSIAMEFKQTAIYARGIGMVEMNEERKVNKKVHKRRIRLTKFEPGAATSL